MNKLKIFCITLKNTPKRKEYAERHFKEIGLDVEFFEGIYGPEFGLKTIIPFDENDFGPKRYIKAGRIGCLLSHFMLWKVLQHSNYEEILILEDDVVLCENFQEKLEVIKNQLPENWDYVFVGHCCLQDKKFCSKISDGIFISLEPPLCTHAYMIKKSTVPILIETNSQAWAAVDIQIQKKSLNHLNYYIFNPPLADQLSLIKQNDNSLDIDSTFDSLTLDSKYDS